MGFQTEQQYITNIGVYKTLSVGSFSFTPAQSFYLIVKRAVDIIGGIVGIVLLLPITLIVKIICLFSGDTGRIFYRQKRVGQNGKEIKIWKYRTMVKNADTMLEEMLKDEHNETERNTLVSAIRNLMENLKLSAEQAMDALKIPKEDQDYYAKKL